MKCARNRVRRLEVFDNFLADFTQIPLRKRFSDFYRLWKDHLDPDFVNVEPGALKKLAKRLEEAEFRFPVPESIKSASRSPDIPTPLELLKRLENFDFSLYPVHRDRLDMCSTSMLSPIINNGIVSIREVYARTVEHPEFTRQLAWREYFYHLKNNFEFMNELELDEKRRNIRWKNDEKATQAFFEARTGYPIVDAAIRQIKIQKWIPNRARMIVASFLTKDLLVDWRTGERGSSASTFLITMKFSMLETGSGLHLWERTEGPLEFSILFCKQKSSTPRQGTSRNFCPNLKALSHGFFRTP